MFASLQALLWGTVAGSALLLGSGAAWWLKIPKLWVSAIMAFGAGVLISALAFELVLEAYGTGGLGATLGGVIVALPCISVRTGCWTGGPESGRRSAQTSRIRPDPRSRSARSSTAFQNPWPWD